VDAAGCVTRCADGGAVAPKSDGAVRQVAGRRARPLGRVDARGGAPVDIRGCPGKGPFTAEPGRIGETARVTSEDAYGRGPASRLNTSLRGRIRHGDSGGPAVGVNGEGEAPGSAARRRSSVCIGAALL